MKKILSNLTNTQLLILSTSLAFALLLFIVLYTSFTSTNKQQSSRPITTVTAPTPSKPESRLFPDDQAVRDTIIISTLHGYQSGVIYESKNVRIEYVSSIDQFQTEILTSNTAEAKNEAVQWLRNKGLSHHGVCHLPIRFYLGSETTGPEAESFNPLPENC